MDIKYRAFMKENNLTFESDVLDPAFVTKAQDFEAKLKANQLTEEEATAIDDELMVMLGELEIVVVESKEVKAERLRAEIAEAKNEITAATTLEEMTALEEKFAHLPGIDKFIEPRIKKLQKELDDQAAKQFNEAATAEITAAAYADLPALAEKYKDYPALVKMINARIEAEDPNKGQKSLREQILEKKKRQWTFDELRALGINVPGDDFEIEGIYFAREYMFKVYHIKSIDGKKV